MKAQMYNYSSWIEETNPKVLLEHFEPIGYTALFLLSESHFAIHTFPEHNQTYIELTSCVKKQFDYFIKNND